MSFLTFSDTVDHVLDQVVGGDASARNLRQAKRAVSEAVEELASRRDWRYYFRPDLIETVAPYDTGTIAYTASTRTVTLTGGTWPTDADEYALVVNGTRYGVESRTSGSVIILRDGDSPTADIASGTSYTLVKDSYLLPETVHKIDYLYDTLAPGRMVPMVSPDSILRERRLVKIVAYPLMYSVFRHEKYHGRMAIHFAPSCSTDRQYAYMALHRPSLPTIYQVGSGTTATVLANSTTVTTSAASTLTAAHAGCVIRFGDASNAPTGPYGYVDGTVNVAAFESVLQTYLTTTTFGMETSPTSALTTVKYMVSSLIDIAPTMRNALLRLAEAKFSPTDRKGYADRLAEYERAYNLAAWSDQTMQQSPGVGFVPHTLSDIAATVAQPA
jgi:hypothetical protein